MEPTSLIVGAAAKAADALSDDKKKEGEGFLKLLFGPAVTELGEHVALGLKEWRYGRLIKTVVRAKEKCQSAGISPHEVPPKIIHPLLEAASLESEPDLQERWANLLANAADPLKSGSTRTAFVRMLGELSSTEVRLLEALYEVGQSDKPEEAAGRPWAKRLTHDDLLSAYQNAGLFPFETSNTGSLLIKFKTDIPVLYSHMDKIDETIDLLVRLGILRFEKITTLTPLPGAESIASTKTDTKVVYQLTSLGQAFIVACSEPNTSRT